MPRGRKRAPGGGGRQSSNYQREVETYQKRLEVINFHDNNGMQATLDKFYQHLVQKKRENKRKRIYEWLKDRERIESVCSSSVKAGLKVIRKVGTATTISTAGEEALKEWVLSLREEGVPVSRLMLQLKAQAIAEDEGVSPGFFSGSWVWQTGYLKRHGLRIRAKTRQGQKKPADMEADAKEFWKNVAQVKEELGVEKVYNADQSGVCFEYLPKHTISEKGAKTVWVRCGGKDKERLTGMFMGDSTGKQYTPFLVLKAQPSTQEHKIAYNHIVQNGFNTLWPEISALSREFDVEIFGNKNAWWTSDLSIRFLDFHFADRTENEPVLLLWDDFSAHWTDEVKEHAAMLNVHLIRVPPGLTSVCQPADVSWFRPFKQRLRSEWVVELTSQLTVHHKKKDPTTFKLTPPSRRDVIMWIMKTWTNLGAHVIKSGFAGLWKCRSGGNPDESDDTQESTAVEPVNELVEALERLNAVEDAVSDSDDMFERYSEDDVEAE